MGPLQGPNQHPRACGKSGLTPRSLTGAIPPRSGPVRVTFPTGIGDSRLAWCCSLEGVATGEWDFSRYDMATAEFEGLGHAHSHPDVAGGADGMCRAAAAKQRNFVSSPDDCAGGRWAGVSETTDRTSSIGGLGRP